MKPRIVLLPGDGIGPEVVREAAEVLERVADVELETHLIGGCAIDAAGTPLPSATRAACERADAALLGAVGGPRWDDPGADVRPEQGLLELRRGFDLYANLRPVRVYPALANCSPLRPELLDGVDILVVRELTGGLYFGRPRGIEVSADGRRAVDTLEYTDAEILRIVRLAFALAGRRSRALTSVDKANVLASSRLWREIVSSLAAEYPEVSVEHQLVDAASMRLVSQPAAFDVIVTENLFGDILSDEASVIAGSMGMLPSASLGDGRFGLYEPVHGSAPDIAGRGIANPLGAILSAAMMLRHSLDNADAAGAIEAAVYDTLGAGIRTADLGGDATTAEMGAAVRARL